MSITIGKLRAEFQKAFGGDGVYALLPLGGEQVAVIKRHRNKVLVRVVHKSDKLATPKGAGGVVSDDTTS